MSNVEHNSQINSNRVAITGLGAITPLGNSVAQTWESLVAGRSGVGPITLMDTSNYSCHIGGELKGFNPQQFIPHKKARHMPIASQLAVVAAGQAVDDAAIDLEQMDRDRVGVIVGNAGGSTIDETERATKQLIDGNSRKLSPFQILRVWPNMSAFFIAQTYSLRGVNSTICTACAAATQAIGEAAMNIRSGKADVMLAGGSEYLLSDTVFAGFSAMRALSSKYNHTPEQAMRPFEADRDGFVPAIGGAFLVLESLEHALARGSRIYAEILGFGISSDAFHMIAPDPDGSGPALAIRRALDDAAITIEEIDYINAHAASTPLGDLAETKAIKEVFGERAYDIPISSTKSMTGHMLGATGALEAIACVMSIQENRVHPTINYLTPDPECDLDYVPNESRQVQVKIAMSNSFGLGGQNAVLILSAV